MKEKISFYKVFRKSIDKDIMGYFIILDAVVDFINKQNNTNIPPIAADADMSSAGFKNYHGHVNTAAYNLFHTIFLSNITRYEKDYFKMLLDHENKSELKLESTVIYEAVNNYETLNKDKVAQPQ